MPARVPAIDPAQTDLYRSLRAEVAKLDSPSAAVDWQWVAVTSERVVRELGQDLLAAVYGVHARHVTQGIATLADGFDSVANLLGAGWDVCTPPPARTKARANAVQWLLQRTVIEIGASKRLADGAIAQDLMQALARLRSLSAQRFAERSPAFAPLTRSLAQLTAPSLAEPAAPRESVEPGELSRGAASGPGAPTVKGIGQQLCELAASRRQANPADPSAYRLLRVGLWLHLESVPPVAGGRTRIAPLAQATARLLEDLEQREAWAELLETVEQTLLTNRLHFGLQRQAAMALQGLGAAYGPCLRAACDEVRNLLVRLPAVSDLQAHDGSSLADGETRAWLAGLLPAHRQQTATAEPNSAPAERRAAPLQPSGRALFLLRLDQAKQASREGHAEVAVAIFAGLYRQLRRHRLRSWDLALSVDVLEGYLQALAGAGKPARLALRVYAQLARLAPKNAIALPLSFAGPAVQIGSAQILS